MTKKDFIRLADYLRGLQVPPNVLQAICDFCKESNPRFMQDRFIRYLQGTCGPNGGSRKV